MDKKILLKSSLLIATLTTTTLTGSIHAKQGFYLGTSTVNATLGHSIERNTGSDMSASISSRAEETDLALGIQAGYYFQLTDNFFVGAEAFYRDENVDTRNLNNLLQTEITLNNSYGLKLKAGVDVNDKFSIYGLIGSTTLDFDIDNSYPFAPPTRSGSEDISEATFGVGAEFQISDRFSVVAEYTDLNDGNFTPLPEVAVPGQINLNELDYSSLSFGVNFNF